MICSTLVRKRATVSPWRITHEPSENWIAFRSGGQMLILGSHKAEAKVRDIRLLQTLCQNTDPGACPIAASSRVELGRTALKMRM